jgi:hypothetical protein
MTHFDELDADDSPGSRHYYAQRHGLQPGRIDLETACKLFRSTITALEADDWLQEWAGYHCVDDGDVPGTGGIDPELFAFRKTRLRGLWPPAEEWHGWDVLHLLTAVEFFFDVVSQPVGGRYHDYMNCGYHGSTFNRKKGRARYQAEVNEFLPDLDDGFELLANGEVLRAVPTGLEDLLADELPDSASDDQKRDVEHAISLFRSKSSTERDQRDAIKTLAGVLESIRPELKSLFIHKDEADLFQIANGFNLRHRNAQQQTHYDPAIFLPWLFYSFLAAVQGAFKLRERA